MPSPHAAEIVLTNAERAELGGRTRRRASAAGLALCARIILAAADGGTNVELDVVSECAAVDIVRVGPYGDRFDGRYEYLAYISSTMPKFKGYSMDLHRVTYVDDGLAFADSARQSKWMARRYSRARCSFSKSTVTGAYRVSGSSSKRRKRLTNSPPRRPPGSLRVADASCASDRGAAAKVSLCVRDFRRGC